MLEIIRSILERKVWDALLLEKFKNFFKKEDTQIAVFIGNILVVGDEAGGIEDDMVVDVIFINVGTDHIFIFSTLHPQIVVPDDVRFRHQFLQA